MKDFLKENNKKKHQFKSYYCAGCNQKKVCRKLNPEFCCSCAYQKDWEKAIEYNSYAEVLVSKQIERERNFRQLQLLRGYRGCKECGSLAVDAYYLYENSQLVCQPCLVKKTGGSSSPISFSEKVKWYKKRWKIDLVEWLENFSQLPVNSDCDREWLKDKGHLNNCKCLEKKVKELVEFYTSSLKEYQEKLKKCKCEVSNKTRTHYYDFANYGYTYCEKCEREIKGAGKHGIIKNRNSPSFWGLEIKEKVLCLNCLQKFQEKMPISKRYRLNKYLKRGY